jgi:hypothetical protein
MEYIKQFMVGIEPHIKYVSVQDESIFSNDYGTESLYLVPKIDFKLFWNSELTDKTKDSVWKYLQALFIIGYSLLESDGKLPKSVKKHSGLIQDFVENLKLDKTIEQGIQDGIGAEIEPVDNGPNIDISELFGGDNIIAQIAQELSEEIKLPKEITDKLGDKPDPLAAIGMLFGENTSHLQDILAKVGEKMEQKMQDKEISQDELMNSAMQMNETLMSSFSNVPGMAEFSQMMNTQMQGDNPEMTSEILEQQLSSMTEYIDKLPEEQKQEILAMQKAMQKNLDENEK